MAEKKVVRKVMIPNSEIELIADERNDSIEVATITNNHDRIIRMVVKSGYSVTIETSYCMATHYQWSFESVGIGLEELIEMGKIAQYVKDRDDQLNIERISS